MTLRIVKPSVNFWTSVFSSANFSISSFDKSASFAYPAGYFALGVAYLLGDDVKKDDAKAKDYLLLALENNVIWAAKALSALHENKASEFYDVERAKDYLTLFQDSRF